MSILLVAGGFHNVLCSHLGDVVNISAVTSDRVCHFINEVHPVFDLILFTDEGIRGNERALISQVEEISQCLNENKIQARMVVATLNREVMTLALPPYVEIVSATGARISFKEFKRIEEKYATISMKLEKETKRQSGSWWKKVFNEDNKASSIPSGAVSHLVNRVVAVTGHRGSGITGTAVNLATTAVREGLSVIVIDLDVICRGMNMYFGGFSETDDENLRNSLVRLLAKPMSYESTAYPVKPDYYMSTLPYSFKDKKLLEQFFTGEKIISLISTLKHRFNLCILDLPIEIAAKYPEILLHIDTVGICVSNNLYSVLNTARNFEAYLPENIRDLAVAKAKVIVTNYNDRSHTRGENFTPKKVCETLRAVSPDFEFIGEEAGYIPHNDEFDQQIETEVQVVNSNEQMSEAYRKILIRILEGAI